MALLCLPLLFSCQDETPSEEVETGDEVNQWIERILRDHYLWYDELPDESSLDFNADPEDFFYSLLSDEDGKDLEEGHHYFSTLEKVSSTKAILDADDSYGFEYATANVNVNGSSYPAALVLYVLKDSPAEEAGLRRGDWIYGVNGPVGTLTDYELLSNGGEVSLSLARLNSEGKLQADRTITLDPSRAVEDTPFLKDSVYTIGGKRIGYLMYNHFSAGVDELDNEDKSYDQELERLFRQFKSEGVTEFVLDLRYNGGGMVSSAQLLASLLAPREALDDTFCQVEYNDKHSDDNLSIPFLRTTETLAGNLDLQRLYILTGSTTASSSELVINGLIPYLGKENVRLIGLQTFGKRVGMSVYNEAEKYGWVLSPVTFRSYNKNHEADYADGFPPDVEVNEFQQDLVELGDTRDPLLEEAIREITGQRQNLRSALPSIPWQIHYDPPARLRDNLLLREEP